MSRFRARVSKLGLDVAVALVAADEAETVDEHYSGHPTVAAAVGVAIGYVVAVAASALVAASVLPRPCCSALPAFVHHRYKRPAFEPCPGPVSSPLLPAS